MIIKSKAERPHVVSRRQFMSLLGLGGLFATNTDPIKMLIRSLVDGTISRAQAGSGGTPSAKNYVSILFPGAPTRWVWDGFLNPNNEPIVRNASVNNWLTENRYTADSSKATYLAEPVQLSTGQMIYLPPLWNRNIPTSAGAPVPMSALLDNTMIMRGVDMMADLGHGIGPAKVLYPLAATASLTGLVGDASNTVIPVVGMGGGGVNYVDPSNQGYLAPKGTAPTLLSLGGNPLSNVLSPFINNDPNVLANASQLNSDEIQKAIDGALDELGTFAKSSLPGADTLYKNAHSAKQLFRQQFGDLASVYAALYNKYYNLIVNCAGTPLGNILPPNDPAAPYPYDITATDRASVDLAAQFAVAEYLLVNGYSSAISMNGGTAVNVAGIGTRNDEHDESDRQRSLICQSFRFLSLSALLYELRSVLMSAGLWAETVIHVSAEFNRSPRNDGGGSDHSTPSNVMTVMSGAIQKPIFIGNTKQAFTSGLYVGHFGYGDLVNVNGNMIPLNNNVAASTLAALLGVQNPITQSESILTVDSSGVTPLCEPAKNTD